MNPEALSKFDKKDVEKLEADVQEICLEMNDSSKSVHERNKAYRKLKNLEEKWGKHPEYAHIFSNEIVRNSEEKFHVWERREENI